MNVIDVRNPIWMTEDHTVVECEVKFAEFEDWLPFGAVATGDMPWTHEIFSGCVAGKYGTIAEYVPPPETVVTGQPESTGTQTI